MPRPTTTKETDSNLLTDPQDAPKETPNTRLYRACARTFARWGKDTFIGSLSETERRDVVTAVLGAIPLSGLVLTSCHPLCAECGKEAEAVGAVVRRRLESGEGRSRARGLQESWRRLSK